MGRSGEAQLDQQAMQICMSEIEHCQKVSPRPNFIILLGDRYGWRPLPATIPEEEMNLILARLTPQERRLVLWEETGEGNSRMINMVHWNNGQPSGQHGWYRLDKNACPPNYLLQPRQNEMIDDDVWQEQAEVPLHAILERVTGDLGWSEKQRQKYFTSATHQEVLEGALKVEDAAEHVFGFFRAIDNLEAVVTGLSQQEGFFHSSAKDYIDRFGRNFDEQSHLALIGLKEALALRLPENICRYSTHWNGTEINQDHIGNLPQTLEECLPLLDESDPEEVLCHAVWQRLAKVIRREAEKLKQQDEIDREIETQIRFGQQQAQGFLGREDILQAISTYLAQDTTQPFVIWGQSGSGKIALMAHASDLAKAQQPNAQIITRFVGATPASTDSQGLLTSLCQEIIRVYQLETKIPSNFSQIIRLFPALLQEPTQEKPLIIFLDALDQLLESQEIENLDWLPVEFPQHVHVIITVTEGNPLQFLRKRIQGHTEGDPAQMIRKQIFSKCAPSS